MANRRIGGHHSPLSLVRSPVDETVDTSRLTVAINRFVAMTVVSLAAILTACASGSAIVTGTTRAPVALESVKIYLEPPQKFEVIGLVNATSDAGWTDQDSLDYAVAELKKQASKLGANGVLLVSSGETVTGFVSGGSYAIPVTGKTAQGKAIFVEE
jgi:hypothetical protein